MLTCWYNDSKKGAVRMSVADSAMTRDVLRDISKRPLDISRLNVHVMHGVVYLQGRVEKVRGSGQEVNLGDEMRIVVKLLKQKPDVRDVCCEVELEGNMMSELFVPRQRVANL